jgi:hypothetical protein
LHFPELALVISDFSDADCPAVSELSSKNSELMPAVILSNRLASIKNLIARQILSVFILLSMT